MTQAEWALRIWQVLVGAAHFRQVLTYKILADMIGIGPPGKGAGVLSKPLGHVMDYCSSRSLPALTSIVVNRGTGIPGEGLTASADPVSERERVYDFNWYALDPPSLKDMES